MSSSEAIIESLQDSCSTIDDDNDDGVTLATRAPCGNSEKVYLQWWLRPPPPPSPSAVVDTEETTTLPSLVYQAVSEETAPCVGHSPSSPLCVLQLRLGRGLLDSPSLLQTARWVGSRNASRTTATKRGDCKKVKPDITPSPEKWLQQVRSSVCSHQAEVCLHLSSSSPSKDPTHKLSSSVEADCITSIEVIDRSTRGNTTVNGVVLVPDHRYHLHFKDTTFLFPPPQEKKGTAADGKEGVGRSRGIAIGLGPCCSLWITPMSLLPPSTTLLDGNDSPLENEPHKKGPTASKPKATPRNSTTLLKDTASESFSSLPASSKSAVVIFTTGMQLSQKETQQCRALGITVNPSLRQAASAVLLVVQAPLIRSVKLMTVLPYIKAMVDQSWLMEVLATRDRGLSWSSHLYREAKTKQSIETVNGFSLAALLARPPRQRQQLLHSWVCWVDPEAVPQDPPLNDLKSVLIANGAQLTKKIREATVLVVPSKVLTDAVIHRIEVARRPLHPVHLLTPDDVFRAVLQQQSTPHTTVELPPPILSPPSSTEPIKPTTSPLNSDGEEEDVDDDDDDDDGRLVLLKRRRKSEGDKDSKGKKNSRKKQETTSPLRGRKNEIDSFAIEF